MRVTSPIDVASRVTAPVMIATPSPPSTMPMMVSGRELSRDPKLLLINQLSRGIDIGATELVMQEVLKQRDAGCAILLISTELEELFGRILVMCGGELVGEVPPIARVSRRSA